MNQLTEKERDKQIKYYRRKYRETPWRRLKSILNDPAETIIFAVILIWALIGFSSFFTKDDSQNIQLTNTMLSFAALMFVYIQLKEGRKEKRLMISPHLTVSHIPFKDIATANIFISNIGLGTAFSLRVRWDFDETVQDYHNYIPRTEFKREIAKLHQTFDFLKIDNKIEVELPTLIRYKIHEIIESKPSPKKFDWQEFNGFKIEISYLDHFNNSTSIVKSLYINNLNEDLILEW